MKILLLSLITLQISCREGERVSSSTVSSIEISTTTLIDYNSNFAFVRAQGTTSDDYLNNDILSFHSDSLCSQSPIGSSLVSQYKSSGTVIQIPANTAVDLYVKSQAFNSCVFLQNYVHDPLVPSEPVFDTISPLSPSRLSNTPGLFGRASPLSSTVELFSDSLCTNLLSSGSSNDFTQIGIAVTLPLNTTSTIYARTRDPLGTLSGCTFMSDFTHSDAYSPYPELISITPLSPSKDSFEPLIRISSAVGTTSISLYSDSGCQNLLLQGNPLTFENTGYDVTLTENATTMIYAQSLDAMSVPSICALLTVYSHDSDPPQPPTYLSSNPASPTNQTTLPSIIGGASADTSEIVFYDSSLCLNSIGTGIRNDFISSGIVISVASNATTQVYARAFDSSLNGTACTFFTSYINNTTPPGNPVFGTINPNSPTNLTTTPFITGLTEDRTVNLYFYKDEVCTLPIGQGDKADYESSGIQLTAEANNTISIYVRVDDAEGNVSDCFFHASFSHSSVAAPDPGFISTFPASPSRSSTTPAVLGSADSSIETVRIYNDISCTGLLSTGTRGQFASSGLIVTVPSNSTNNIYARATDIYGNLSACVFLTTYIHTNVQPLTPIYSSIAPVSPNNQSFTPSIFGDSLVNPASQLPPTRVDFFDSGSCVSLLGQGTPNEYATTGVVINVAPNAESSIYGKSYDDAGNESDCAFLTFYTHNGLVPAVPLFSSASPASPSYNSQIRIFGTYGSSSDFMNRVSLGIYSDSSCMTLLQSSNPTLFNSTGIPLSLTTNTTTSLYGRTVNEVGTASACQFLTNFTHYNLPPNNLTVNLNTNGSVRLNWNPDTFSSPSPKYSIERALQSGGPYTSLASEQLSNSYVDSNISNNKLYFYRVYSTNITGRSQYSSEVSITTSAPAAVTVNNLAASPNDSAIFLNWSGFPQNMTYRIFRSQQFGGPFTDLGIITSSNSYLNSGLSNNQEYFYFVKASNPSGESVQSNIVSSIPRVVPNAPTQFAITPLQSSEACSGGRGVRLSWAASNYYNNFDVYRGNSKSSTNVIGSVGVPYYDDCSMPSNDILYYKTSSIWGGSYGNSSNVMGIYTSTSPNFNLTASDNQIRLTWSVPGLMPGYTAGDLSYTIYKSLDPDKNFSVLAAAHSGTSFTDSIVNGQGAYYYVQAYVIDGASDKIFMGFPTAVQGRRAAINPSDPTNLNLTYFNSDSRAQLDWISPSHFNNFRLYRATNSLGPYTLVQTVTNTFIPTAPLVQGLNYFRLTAMWGSYETAPTNVVSFRNAPIIGLFVTPQLTSIDLNWNAVPGVSDYVISRSNSINGPFVNINVAVTNTFTDSTVSADTGYYYKVKARFSDLTEGQWSSAVSGQSTNSLPPSDISLTVVGNTQIHVDWPRVSGATIYQIQSAFSALGPFTTEGTTALNNFDIYGLAPQTEYFIRVTSIVSGSPHESGVKSIYTFVPTTAPIGIEGNNQVSISWAAMPNATNYDIERSTDGINFSAISTNYTMNNYTDMTATNGQVYFYRILTKYIPLNLLSDSSIGFTPGRTPLSPTNLNAENNGTGNEVELKWTDISGRTSFNIYRSTTSGVYGAPIQSSLTANGTRISGLVSGTTYYFRVTALNGTNESLPSNEINIVPSANSIKPDVQLGLPSQIQISWSAVVGANTYDVFRSLDGVNFEKIASSIPAISYADSPSDITRTYYYKYQSLNGAGTEMAMSQVSDAINISVIPLTPTGLHLVSQSTTSVSLSWASVPSISNYEVLRSSTPGGPYSLISSPAFSDTNYTDTTVVAGQSYYYVLRTVNTYGVRSSNSNEVSVNLVSGPANLVALNGTSSIDLTWNSLAGVTGYEILRSQSVTGPFGVIGSTASLLLSDSNVIADIQYHYVVQGVYADGRRSVLSNVVSVLRDGSLRIQVPIELTDIALASSQLQNLIFQRSLTSFNTNNYDGVTSYQLEIVATNFDSVSRSVGITNEANNLIDFITVPANTLQPTLIKNTINIPNGNYKFRVELEQTNSDGQLSVLTAKLLVNQVNATKTRIYYPLINSDIPATNSDQSVYAYSTSNSAFHDFINATYFTRRASKLDLIEAYNGWELEALVSTTGGAEGVVALQNINTSQILAVTETRFVDSQIRMASIPFNEGITNFRSVNENHNYRVVIRCEFYCGAGSVQIHKAGVWVKLKNLSKASIVFRVTGLKQNINSNSLFSDQRVNLNLSSFSSPYIYYQALTQTGISSQGQVRLNYHNQNFGENSINVLATSNFFINSELVQLHRTPALVGLPMNENYMTYVEPSQGEVNLRSSEFLIETSP